MSELINKHDNSATIRWKLLTGASVLALTAYVSSADLARAEDSDRAPLWVEMDGQFAQQRNGDELFLPDFAAASQFQAASRANLENVLPVIWNVGGSVSYRPDSSDWVLSLGVRYGRSGKRASLNQQTAYRSSYGGYNAYQRFQTRNTQSHTIADFRVGKDIGIGRFSSGGSSLVSLGVRYAQFKGQRDVGIESQPTNIAGTYGAYHKFYAAFEAKSDFSGIGPSISWNASANIAGNSSSESISLDWGVNAAALFGRQKVRGHQESTNLHVVYPHRNIQSRYSTPLVRSKRVTVPNLGGFAGVSWRTSNAKISLGYRADMFFGAIDGGIATAKKENRSFYGPFASISVGIGD